MQSVLKKILPTFQNDKTKMRQILSLDKIVMSWPNIEVAMKYETGKMDGLSRSGLNYDAYPPCTARK